MSLAMTVAVACEREGGEREPDIYIVYILIHILCVYEAIYILCLYYVYIMYILCIALIGSIRLC